MKANKKLANKFIVYFILFVGTIFCSFYFISSIFAIYPYTYDIQGFAYDSSTGLSISSGTVTAIIKENGDRNTTTITNGVYNANISTTLNFNQTKFTIGLIFTGEGKKGYSQIVIGNGAFVQQTQKCSTNQLHFTGIATDTSSGTTLVSGTVTTSVKDAITYTNSTAFSSGTWDIYLSPCLISGGLYTFNFIIRSTDGRQSNLFVNQVAS